MRGNLLLAALAGMVGPDAFEPLPFDPFESEEVATPPEPLPMDRKARRARAAEARRRARKAK